MVYFCCDGCGDTLKKNQVDAHAQRCRQCDSVSCVDCCVSFYGDDYKQHTFCMTESERYEKKPAKHQMKTKNPQQDWMQLVTNCITTAPNHLKSYLQTMSNLDNIPRKEKQFRNFTSNSLNLKGNRGNDIVEQIWNLLKSEKDKRMQETQQQKEKQQKQSDATKLQDNATTLRKDMENKKQSDDDENNKSNNNLKTKTLSSKEFSNGSIDPKKVTKAMKKVLKKAPNKSMKVKKLRKVLSESLGLPKSAKKSLKKMVLEASNNNDANQKAKIKIDGKIVMLMG